MNDQHEHPLLVRRDHDDESRQQFARSLRAHLLNEVQPGVYHHVAAKAATEGPITDRHQVREMIADHPYYRTFSASLRTAQERIWDSVIDAVEKDYARLKSAYLETGAKAPTAGSLRLNADLVIPDYHATVDIHLQPGGYHTERGEYDIAAGAIYDRAVFLYANGRFGNQTQLMGETLVEELRTALPEFRPERILEIGCTVGNSIIPYATAFPEAEIHAIDVAAPCLRYAHARAEALGTAIHFSQQNAEKTDFAEGSFDLIVSHILFHETSRTAVDNVLLECRRLLKPGGYMAHLDLPRQHHFKDQIESFLHDWEAHNNNETFHKIFKTMSLTERAQHVGFPAQSLNTMMTPLNWPLLLGQR
jgi:ubiquinone/menaquinone biosynthesis C-methylase UbiE|tara:strand:- start:678 stop:1763 length:1086 start_codon:yes stop_codon:yes gene_type:complete